jgi:D-3-phosphoglycerate dehydrogenase
MSEMIKILVADKLAKEGLDYLQNAGDVAVDVKVGLSEDELAAVVGEYDGLIVRSGAQVTAKVLEAPGRLRGVCRAGVGVDNIDLPAATSRGVLVMNSAEATTITTAELAFSLLMALARNIGPAYKSMTEGAWDKSKFVGRQLGG